MHSLILGGARSGKSRYAQLRAEATGMSAIYIATAQARDDEMKARIQRHQLDRGDAWRTVEEPIALAEAIGTHSAPDRVLLVDCLTLWVTNLLLANHDINAAAIQLTDAIAAASGQVFLVSNETGLGVVPENALARRFLEEAGRLNQLVAARADEVQFVAAGLTLKLK